MYHRKPLCQVDFEKQVRGAVYSICAGAGPAAVKPDLRPRLLDRASGLSVLLDTGACVSIWPRNKFRNVKLDPNKHLQAVNGTRIPTYGDKVIKIKPINDQIGYYHKVILADVQEPILGFNFMLDFKLDLKWGKNGKCFLNDAARGHSIRLKMDTFHNTSLNLALVSFKQYSQSKSEQASKSAPAYQVPAEYKALIEQYPKLLEVNFLKKPPHGIVHHISTGSHRPCKAKPRPLLPGTKKATDAKRDWFKLEELGVIERAKADELTTWISPLHLAMKSDGTYRPCGDYRSLNSKTDDDSFPLPQIRHFSSELKGASHFSSLDLFRAYYNIELDDESATKTAIASSWGIFKFRRLSMGLKNAAQSFQRFISTILDGISGVFVYLDDLLLFHKNKTDHDKCMKKVFEILQLNGLTLNLGKCRFNLPEIDYLGYRVNGSGITPLPRKLSAIADYPTPAKPKQLSGFLGALSYYRRSLPKIDGRSPAEVLDPLYQAASRKTPGVKFTDNWNKDGLQEHFDRAKRMLMLATQLSHPDPTKPLALRTDASKLSMGAALEQLVNGRWEPLGFWSKKFKPNQTRWSTFKRELCAIKDAIRHFMAEIDGRKLSIFTDHLPILGAFRNQDALKHDPIALGHLLEIAHWSTDIQHVSGPLNQVADALSRIEEPASSGQVPAQAYSGQEAEESRPVFSPPSTMELLSTAAVESPDSCVQFFETVDHRKMEEEQRTDIDVIAHRAGNHVKGLRLTDIEFSPGIFLLCDMSDGKKARPVVPKAQRATIIRMYHQLAHPGKKETIRKIADRYYWPNMKSDIATFVSQCIPCNTCKPHKTIIPPLDSRPVLQPHFQDIMIDLVGPLPPFEGQRYLLTIICRTSRWLDAIPLPEATAANTCRAFIDNWVKNYGLPSKITSDNGVTFTSNLWRDLNQQLNTIVAYTPIYSPASLGSLERQHADLKSGLKAALVAMGDEFQSNWMRCLPWVLLSRRTSFHGGLQATPAQAVFGEDVKLPGDLAPPLGKGETIQEILERVQTNAQRPPAQTAHHKVLPTYMPTTARLATHVYTKRPKKSPLGPINNGPYPIIRRLGKSCIEIKVGETPNGAPRLETRHWRTCSPTTLADGQTPAVRQGPGRRRSPRGHPTPANDF